MNDRELLAALALPRLVGSANHARVRDILKAELSRRGFVVMEQRFPARTRWPLRGVTAVEGVNLIAVRPRSRVAVWITAHYDSKGQPVSMALRLGLVGGAVAALIGIPVFGVVALGVALLLAALFLTLNRVTDASPGAVDNAAALVATFAILDTLPASAAVGVIFPDAEELGLVGARALVRERANLLAGTAVINLDGLDDLGGTIAVQHRPGPLTRAIAKAIGATSWPWLPVVVDGQVLARAAGECLTVMRGGWRTMGVVHTPRDTTERLSFAGARDIAAGIASVLAR